MPLSGPVLTQMASLQRPAESRLVARIGCPLTGRSFVIFPPSCGVTVTVDNEDDAWIIDAVASPVKIPNTPTEEVRYATGKNGLSAWWRTLASSSNRCSPARSALDGASRLARLTFAIGRLTAPQYKQNYINGKTSGIKLKLALPRRLRSTQRIAASSARGLART